MSTLKVLKEYLVGSDGGYLLNDDNNGKTVMLSGAWGSGKTHFWQNEIEEDLTTKLNANKKACVYVSLYGKDNIEAIKNEILFKAYESIKDENKLAKRAISAFGFSSRLLSVSVGGVRTNTGAVGDIVEDFFESKKIDEAESFLVDGGLICLDDFERKSKHIDLNDLFGFIAQLAIDMNCKVVIILNSDVFKGEEANVFKTVKEKTVNKFFYFEPTRRELFDSIYDREDNKYEKLDAYREDIFNAINETEELNARIYIQVLDNCLEWIKAKDDRTELKVLVLVTVNFILNNFILEYSVPVSGRGLMGTPSYKLEYTIFDKYPVQIADIICSRASTSIEEFKKEISSINYDILIQKIDRKLNGKTKEGQAIFTPAIQEKYFIFLNDNKKEIRAIWKYGYELYCMDTIDEITYNEIANFVQSGILLCQKDNL